MDSKYFPLPIQNLPEVDIHREGVTAFSSQATDYQILFMEFDKDVELPPHSHAAQIGFV